MDIRIPLLQANYFVGRPIRRAVVHEQDRFPTGRRADPGHQYRDVVTLVQGRNDHHADPSW
jgi:hypothetical protein